MVLMKIKDLGTIKLELYPDDAPITVDNFVSLASSGFYDGLIFHRVINDFMIQGGDPTGTGLGSPDQKRIKGEFEANGIKNPIKHTRGTISMARSQNYNSASSQFFICHTDCNFLDGQYAAFGRVTEGMDIVDKIATCMTDHNDRPIEKVVIEEVSIVPDEIPDCLFCKIAADLIPSTKIYEDRYMLAFKDINPQAAVHAVVIPKKHIMSLDDINADNSVVISRIFEKIPHIAKLAGANNGYRVVSNCKMDGRQSVMHLHFHILGGQELSDKMA